MTFIIAIQAEDSVVLASDTRHFTSNQDYQLQNVIGELIKKSELWSSGIYASNGIDTIGSQVYQQLCQTGDIKNLQYWLINACQNFSRQFGVTSALIQQQINATQIYCSSWLNGRSQLRMVSQTTTEFFEVNHLRIMSYQEDLTPILSAL